ncbi:MAG: hypothetical protein IKZ05_06180 [Clostridia bacterium]|nr:hypothetical protein [Clostridia bacterium]
MNGTRLLFRYLPLRISKALHLLPDSLLESADELRLRKSAPCSITVHGKSLTFSALGRICPTSEALCASGEEIAECVLKLTEGSRYTCDEFIKQGFIPLAEGGRAGVCGRSDGRGGIGEILSVSLRIHRLIPNAADVLLREFLKRGVKSTLVCAPPAMGKTTFLTSAAYLLSHGAHGIGPFRVCIADERNELAPSGIPFGLCDILSGIPKAEAITMLTRTMSPEIIVCDEITEKEAEAITAAQGTGVTLIASAHCESPCDLLRRGSMKTLMEQSVFSLFVTLDKSRKATVTEGIN